MANLRIVKSETDDLEKALEIVRDQRPKVNTAWIEDETGAVLDERTLETDKPVTPKRFLLEWLGGPLFICAYILLGLFVLYLIGLWVDS
jgi:hypothetical protein